MIKTYIRYTAASFHINGIFLSTLYLTLIYLLRFHFTYIYRS